jgi:PAS domain S-box-containing protein
MFAGVAEDITEAQQAKEVLRQSEEKFRRILASVPDVTWTSDQYGRTVYISPKVEDVFGYTSQEIYESHGGLWPERLHPDGAGRVIRAYRALFETRSPFDEEYRLRRKDGTWIWVHDRAIRTHEENGVLYAGGIFCDITRRKRADAVLQSNTAFLEAQANCTIDGILVVDDCGHGRHRLDRRTTAFWCRHPRRPSAGQHPHWRGSYAWRLLSMISRLKDSKTRRLSRSCGRIRGSIPNWWRRWAASNRMRATRN